MRIAIQTLGTRGDVQPYIALARRLIARGHSVQLSAPAQFEAMLGAYAVPFVPLPGEFLAMMDTPEGKAAIAGGQGFSAGFKLLKHVRPMMRRLLDAEWAASQAFEPDLIVYHPKSIAAPHIAERLGVPSALASPLPGFTPTGAFPSPMLPFRSLGLLNRPSHLLAIRGADLLFAKLLGEWRHTSLGLPGRARPRAPKATLYAYSPHVVPVPADWGAGVHVTGYWFLDSPEWQPPPDLASFLEAKPAPVYIGFGSMPGLDPTSMSAIAAEALARTGKRGLLAAGGGALQAGGHAPNLHFLESAPHDRLFPLVSAVVHHGGAGTTGAALRAGKPTALCPFFGDQPFWARRVAELGVGPAALDRRTLTAERLAAALLAMDDADMRQRAATLGEQIRGEDGPAEAVAVIEALAARRPG